MALTGVFFIFGAKGYSFLMNLQVILGKFGTVTQRLEGGHSPGNKCHC